MIDANAYRLGLALLLLAIVVPAMAFDSVGSPAPADGFDPAGPLVQVQDGDNGEDADGGNGNNAAAPNTGDGDRMFGEEALTDEARELISRGLRYLVAQQHEDGYFLNPAGAGGGGLGERFTYNIAVTSLAGLSLLASGSVPGRGPYAENVERAVRWLLSVQGRDTGYFSADDDASNIHGHGYATLFLAQVYGMVRDPDLRELLESAIRRSIRLTERGQTDLGGWGYVPTDELFDEASTTVTQIQAMRAARDAGITVTREAIDEATRYIYRSKMLIEWTDADGNTRTGYNFRYSLRLPGGDRVSYPLTVAGLSVLQGLGEYDGPVMQGGLEWAEAWLAGRDRSENADAQATYERWFYYSHFYASQVMYHAPQPSSWNNYFPIIREELGNPERVRLFEQENESGDLIRAAAWQSDYGQTYATALATLVLQIPRGFLPLFQR